MASKKQTSKSSKKRSDLYSVDKDGNVTTSHTICPKCGPGFFMGEHKDRSTCGKCGYTVFKK
ncbi:MAG TPA: 30S ribosomal protein S27ae [Methanocorpusculum sp.]|nr:30S ribosomal protein S27ae [Methanocorpusculum sp.]